MCGALIPITLFSGGEMAGMAALAVPGGNAGGRRSKGVLGHGWAIVQSYIWLGWAAYCAWVALSFASVANVENPWVYYLTALAATGAPVAWLHIRDRSTSTTDDELVQLQRGANLWRVLLLFCGMVFLIAPQLMAVPYGWFPQVERRLIGRSHLAVTQHLDAAQEHLVPPIESHAPIVPDARQGVLFGVLTGAAHQIAGQGQAPPSIEDPCEKEHPRETGLESEGETDDRPCAITTAPR
jgi:hypothetical protein